MYLLNVIHRGSLKGGGGVKTSNEFICAVKRSGRKTFTRPTVDYDILWC